MLRNLMLSEFTFRMLVENEKITGISNALLKKSYHNTAQNGRFEC